MLAFFQKIFERIHKNGEDAYPEDGAGFLIGNEDKVEEFFPATFT
jgi:hypothetical protein